jgi:hypothetical protein
MEFFELSHKQMITRPDGCKVPVAVVGRRGEWSIPEACRLIIRRDAMFFYRGDVVRDLATLPEQASKI